MRCALHLPTCPPACLRACLSLFLSLYRAAACPLTPHAIHVQLDALDAGGVFQYDVTQPMGPGTPLAVTKVTRTCVGDPGITYKYLGLRMFSHPWTDEAAPTDSASSAVSNAYTLLRRQNEALDERSQRCLEREGKGGSTHFSLTLINRMDPTGLKPDLKDEPEFGMGKVSVSWHADSSLVHESTIAVYCVHRGDNGAWLLPLESNEETKKRKLREEKEAKKAAAAAARKKHKVEGGQAQPGATGGSGLAKDKAWRVALRVVHDIEGPNSRANNDITQSKGRKRDFRDVGEDGVKTSKIDDNVTPAVVIQTNDGDAYYMLGDFNHVSQVFI